MNFHHLTGRSRRLFVIITLAILLVTQYQPNEMNAALAAGIPTPLYPKDYTTTTPATDPPLGVPSFSWSTIPDAMVYRLQVDNEVNFGLPIYLDITSSNNSFTPQSLDHLFMDGNWFWRVKVDDPIPGDWSPVMHFTKIWATQDNLPTLLAPGDGAVLAFFDFPAFSWSRVSGAASYLFQVATAPGGFDTPILSVVTLSTTYQPEARYANGIYYWRVLPIDASDHPGTASEVRSFTLAYGTDALNMVPALLQPKDESFPTFTPTFHWTAIQGAEYYRLEYTTDTACDFSNGQSIETRQTYYTPTNTFSNDARYCWRVRVEASASIGDWSPTWHFQKHWNLAPLLLTPTQHYPTGLYPLYSWAPVPGAAQYSIQISNNPEFNPIIEESTTANTTYAPRTGREGSAHYWWHVLPIDGSGNSGYYSEVSDYQNVYTSTAPILIHPLYYYVPNNYNGAPLNPYEDRTTAYPVFMWHRVMHPAPDGGVFASAYRIEVDTSPSFPSPDWEADTENTSAAPTELNNYIPTVGQDYYWHVYPLDHLGGSCQVNSVTGEEWWSQTWRARFDPSLAPSATGGPAPTLLRPAHTQESVEATPILEWYPFLDATRYQVEISRSDDFATYEISETVDIPTYSPGVSLAQRSLGRTNYGSFYWRVRGFTTGWSSWSDPWRFQLASQSEWRYNRSMGNPANQLQIGADAVEDAPAGYDLSSLYASQDEAAWYLGFHATVSTTSMTYAFFIDLDNQDGSGAMAVPERNYLVSIIPAHQPEFIIYVDEINGVIDAKNVWVFAWDGSAWGFGERLGTIGGAVYVTSDYIELKLPDDAIGMTQETSSASIMLVSVDVSDGTLQDSTPSDPLVPGDAILSRFSAVSERLNLIYPPDSATGDPLTTPSVLPFYWDWPTGSNPSTPFAGSIVQVDQDEQYTPPHEASLQISSDTTYLSQNDITLLNDIAGDSIYYWRVQPRYWQSGRLEAFGAWAGGWSFQRQGFKAQHLSTSVTFTTPTFKWDMAEGANSYQLQVSIDPTFGTWVIDQNTSMNSYTPPNTLPQGHYYWRVQVLRAGGIQNGWSQVEQFDLSLPAPTGLTPNDELLHYAPTFCWDPLEGYDNGELVLTAWMYRLQVSQDPNFGNIYDEIDTHNHCWTPLTGYHDGTYYWRVAMIDGDNLAGDYSPAVQFTKRYPVATLISPISGNVAQTPTFTWSPVDGAATYIFEASQYSTFSPIYDAVETINTQYTPRFRYAVDRLYYWRVAIRDHLGRQGPFNDASIIIGRCILFLPFIKR